MNSIFRFSVSALALVTGLGLGIASPVPAVAAMRPNCSSDANIWHVHRRLDGAIDRLSHDQHDYGGNRVAAMNDLQSARTEIVAAEQYAITTYHANPGCFQAHGPTGGSDAHWGTRGQGKSNSNLWMVDRWVGRMISQLESDQRHYGGHRTAAIRDMQSAQSALKQAEAYAKAHGH
jgi:hypothetical protein